MRIRPLAFCFSTLAVSSLLALGCSGAAPSELFATDGSTTPTPTTTTPVDPPPTPFDGGPTPTPVDAGRDATDPPKDAGKDAPVIVIDAGPPKPTVGCGLGACDVSTQFCCNKWNGQTYVPACQALNTACNPGTFVYCDGKSDCPNNGLCCGNLNNQGQYYTDVRCTQTCTGYVGQYQQVRFCDPKAIPDECQPLGLQCQASSLFPAYTVCR